MRRLGFLNCVLLFQFIFSSLYAANKIPPPASPALPEIHLLVDISGSMKKTDPQNLRTKAINMFVYLIKNKASMQIQTFATDTQTMIPFKLVDANFQNEYKQKNYQISSNGQWTDIDGAINTANHSWGLGKKIIVLLTDGDVDLGNEFRTKQSKNKLAESTIANLNKSGVRVFNIGFSKNADKELLDNLALKTNGLSQVVNESKDLDNVLYAIFTAIITVNGTPIEVDKDSSRVITIDKNIHALTLILKKTNTISLLFLSDPKGRKKNVEALSKKDVSTANYLFIDINVDRVKNPLINGAGR